VSNFERFFEGLKGQWCKGESGVRLVDMEEVEVVVPETVSLRDE